MRNLRESERVREPSNPEKQAPKTVSNRSLGRQRFGMSMGWNSSTVQTSGEKRGNFSTGINQDIQLLYRFGSPKVKKHHQNAICLFRSQGNQRIRKPDRRGKGISAGEAGRSHRLFRRLAEIYESEAW